MRGDCKVLLTDAVLDGGVKSVDDGGTPVGDPVGFVDGLAQLLEQVLGSEEGQVEDRFHQLVRRHLQLWIDVRYQYFVLWFTHLYIC